MSKTNTSPHMGLAAKLGRQQAQDHSGKTCIGIGQGFNSIVCKDRERCARHLAHAYAEPGAPFARIFRVSNERECYQFVDALTREDE